MIICSCNVVRADEIRSEVRLGAETVGDVAMRCGAGARCGGCHPGIESVIADEHERAVSMPTVGTAH